MKENNVEHLDYYVVPKIQIETAINLYKEKNFICAVTLAAAADGFLGKTLGGKSAFHELKKKAEEEFPDCQIDLNACSNFFKHGGQDLLEQEINVKAEAIQLICRSICNFLKYSHHLTKTMEGFANEHTPEKIAALMKDNSAPSASLRLKKQI